MEYIKIIFEEKFHSFSKTGNLELYILARFLISDVAYWAQSFIDWTLDPKQTITGSNVTDLEKRDGMVFIKDTFEEDSPYFGYLISDFIQMLKDWDKIIKTTPKKIIITKDDSGKISIQGIGKLGD